VRESEVITEQEALAQHLNRLRGLEQRTTFFRQLDGKSFKRFNGQEVTLEAFRPADHAVWHDAEGTHPRLFDGPKYFVHPAGHWRARAYMRSSIIQAR